MTYYYNTFLAHHGVKGQKWGVRNGPPYPLGSGKKRHEDTKKDNIKRITESLSNKLAGCDPTLISFCMQLAMPVVAYAAVYTATKISFEKTRKKHMQELDDRLEDSNIKHVSDLPKTLQNSTPNDNMKVTNPGFPDNGRTDNCTFCSAAMAMREKGYDVQAKTSTHGWYTPDLFKKTFNADTISLKSKNANQTLNTLSGFGDGAYGQLSVTWTLGGAHSLFWKNENGRTRIYDGQSGKEFDIKYGEYASYIDHKNTDYTRLDNCEPTDYVNCLVEPRTKGDSDGS